MINARKQDVLEADEVVVCTNADDGASAKAFTRQVWGNRGTNPFPAGDTVGNPATVLRQICCHRSHQKGPLRVEIRVFKIPHPSARREWRLLVEGFQVGLKGCGRDVERDSG